MVSVMRTGTGRSSQFNEIFAATRTVDASGAGTDLTIQAAIDNLPAAGGTVFIRQGTYAITSALALPDKPVRFIGTNRGATIIDIGSNAIAAFSGYTNSNWVFENFTVKGGNVAGQIFLNVTGPATVGRVILSNLDIGSTGAVEKFLVSTAATTFVSSYDCSFNPKIGGYVFQEAGAGLIEAKVYNFRQSSNAAILSTSSGATFPVIYAYNSVFYLSPAAVNEMAIGYFQSCTVQGVGSLVTLRIRQAFLDQCYFGYYVHIEVSSANSKIMTSSFNSVDSGAMLSVLTAANDTAIIGCWFNGGGAAACLPIYVDRPGVSIIGCRIGSNFAGGATRLVDITLAGSNIRIEGCEFSNASTTNEAIRTASLYGTFVGNIRGRVLETGAADSNFYDGNYGFSPCTIIGASSRVGWMRGARSVSADTNLDETYDTVLVDASGAARTMTLPTAASMKHRTLTIKKIDSTVNTVTIDGNGAETIDDQATVVLNSQYQSRMIISDGTEWWII